MKKKVLGVIALVILISILAGIYIWNVSKPLQKSDALKFKESYESLNGTIRESDRASYNNVTIPEDNPMKYISAKEAVEIIKNKTGIIYFGANWCPWCRNAVEVLIESAQNNDLDTIYYVDLTDIRNTWAIQEGKLIKTQEEQEGYYELLSALDSELGDKTYVLKDENGQEYDTKEKRIYLPFVIAVKEGNIVSRKLGTVTLNEKQTKYDKMTSEQHDELLNVYNDLIKAMQKK